MSKKKLRKCLSRIRTYVDAVDCACVGNENPVAFTVQSLAELALKEIRKARKEVKRMDKTNPGKELEPCA